jgi:hypothetical protein
MSEQKLMSSGQTESLHRCALELHAKFTILGRK